MKSGFLTTLSADLKEGSDRVWIIDKPLKYWSESLNGLSIIPPWFETIKEDTPIQDFFETDFASVPRVPVVYIAWGNRAHREATLHDYNFRTDSVIIIYSDEARGECGYLTPGARIITRRPVTFLEANSIFLESMQSTGKPAYIRYPMYCGVMLGSYSSYHKRMVKDKL